MLKEFYRDLILKHYYNEFDDLKKKIVLYGFFSYSFRVDNKNVIPLMLSYLCFFLSLKFSQYPKFIFLKKSVRRFNIRKKFPLGLKYTINNFEFIVNWLFIYSYYFYYNAFGELKNFLLDKKRGKFILFKFPILNIFYLLNFNLITFFLFNLEIKIPDIKILLYSGNSLKEEMCSIQNFFLLF